MTPAPAHAQRAASAEKGGADQSAKEIFAKGDTAYAEGRYEEALASFKEAYELSGRPQLLFNISNAAERLGRYGEAVEALEKYLASGKAKDRDVVQKRLVNLRARVDEQKREDERKAKEDDDKRKREAAERERLEEQARKNQKPDKPEEKPTPILPIVLLGTGAAALAAGGVFGVMTLSARSDAKAGCADASTGHLCNEDARSALDREKTFGLVADISLASGVVLGAAGAYLFFFDTPNVSVKKGPSARVVPTIGGGALVGTF